MYVGSTRNSECFVACGTRHARMAHDLQIKQKGLKNLKGDHNDYDYNGGSYYCNISCDRSIGI